MCFSASASFGASALLAGAGILAIKKVESRKMLPFAATPLLFSVHQFSEGMVWLTFSNPDLASWQQAATYFYLFIAQLTWPLWVPFVVWLMEPDQARKKLISYFMWIGGAFSIYLLYCFINYEVSAVVESSHIRYQMHFPNLALRRVFYFLATIVPIFLSSLRYMKLLGGAFLGSLILTFIFYTLCVISVWCFFAALLSALVLLVLVTNKQANIPLHVT